MSHKRSSSEDSLFDHKRPRTTSDTSNFHRLQTPPPSVHPTAAPDSPPVHRQERRRVNPDALALKLGPQVVADLKACITPGMTEMPSFEVRKRIQQRYNIDRRHIYDWFHAMGLRCIKDDKATPARQPPRPKPVPELTSRRLRQPPPRGPVVLASPASIDDTHVRSPPVAPYHQVFKPPGRRRKNDAAPQGSRAGSSFFVHGHPSPPVFNIGRSMHYFHDLPRGDDGSYSVDDDASGAHEYPADDGRHFSPMHGPLHCPSTPIHELGRPFIPYPQSQPALDPFGRFLYPNVAVPIPSYPQAHLAGMTIPDQGPDEQARTDASEDEEELPTAEPEPMSLEELKGEPVANAGESAALFSSDLGSCTPEERQETYSFIAEALGPQRSLATGNVEIQESKGSYRAYKQNLSRLYFGKLLDATDKTPEGADSVNTKDEAGFARWLAPAIYAQRERSTTAVTGLPVAPTEEQWASVVETLKTLSEDAPSDRDDSELDSSQASDSSSSSDSAPYTLESAPIAPVWTHDGIPPHLVMNHGFGMPPRPPPMEYGMHDRFLPWHDPQHLVQHVPPGMEVHPADAWFVHEQPRFYADAHHADMHHIDNRRQEWEYAARFGRPVVFEPPFHHHPEVFDHWMPPPPSAYPPHHMLHHAPPVMRPDMHPAWAYGDDVFRLQAEFEMVTAGRPPPMEYVGGHAQEMQPRFDGWEGGLDVRVGAQ